MFLWCNSHVKHGMLYIPKSFFRPGYVIYSQTYLKCVVVEFWVVRTPKRHLLDGKGKRDVPDVFRDLHFDLSEEFSSIENSQVGRAHSTSAKHLHVDVHVKFANVDVGRDQDHRNMAAVDRLHPHLVALMIDMVSNWYQRICRSNIITVCHMPEQGV